MMHTVTLQQSNVLPDRPRTPRGRLRVSGQSGGTSRQFMDIRPLRTLPLVPAARQRRIYRIPVVNYDDARDSVAVRSSGDMSAIAPLAMHLANVTDQADELSRLLEEQDEPALQIGAKKRKGVLRSLFSLRNVTGVAAVLILIGAGYVTVDTWLTNRRLTEAAGSNQRQVAAGAASSVHEKRSEGRDETPLPANALAAYSVAADKPRALYIDKLDVKARILPVGVNTDSSMQAPTNVFDAGWYTGSSKPDELGAVAIDGHSSGATKLGAFGKLGELDKGDKITIEKGNGTKVRYEVVAKETIDRNKVDMRKFLLPYGDALKGANFMTCSGDWTDDNSTMEQRTIIYTQQIT